MTNFTFKKWLAKDNFNSLRRTGILELKYSGISFVPGRVYSISNYGSPDEVIYAECSVDAPYVLKCVQEPLSKEIEGLSKDDLLLLSKLTGNIYAEVKGDMTKILGSEEEIPLEHHSYQERPEKDGLYKLSEVTCGGSLTNGRGSNFRNTPENRDKYQCRVGRHAPKCNAYSKKKCAVFSFSNPEKDSFNIQASDLIALVSQ